MKQNMTVTLDNTEYTIEINGSMFSVNGQPFVIDIGEDGTVTVDGIAYDVMLKDDVATVGGIDHQVQVSGLKSRPSVASSAPPLPQGGGEGEIRAIMPGTIVRIPVSEGDEVKEDDVLVVLEAMKMENELRASFPGTVGAVFVQPGQIVAMNAVLVRIDSVI